MPQPNDLSRSLVALDHNSTIIAVHEAGDPQISPAWQMLLAMRADRVLRRRERGALPALAPFGWDRDESLFRDNIGRPGSTLIEAVRFAGDSPLDRLKWWPGDRR